VRLVVSLKTAAVRSDEYVQRAIAVEVVDMRSTSTGSTPIVALIDQLVGRLPARLRRADDDLLFNMKSTSRELICCTSECAPLISPFNASNECVALEAGGDALGLANRAWRVAVDAGCSRRRPGAVKSAAVPNRAVVPTRLSI